MVLLLQLDVARTWKNAVQEAIRAGVVWVWEPDYSIFMTNNTPSGAL